MANGVYNRGKYLLATGTNLGTANLYLALVKSDYTYEANNNHFSDLSANEISVSGYTANGIALTNKAVVEDDTNGFAFLYANNVEFGPTLASGQTVGGAVLYIGAASAATSQVVAFYDLTDTPTNGGSITVNWAANSAGSVLKLSNPA